MLYHQNDLEPYLTIPYYSHHVAITSNAVEEFRKTIENLIADTLDRLDSINTKLGTLSLEDDGMSNSVTIQQEMMGLKERLNMCNEASQYINQIKTLSSREITSNCFRECVEICDITIATLNSNLQQVNAARGFMMTFKETELKLINSCLNLVNESKNFGTSVVNNLGNWYSAGDSGSWNI
jgi:hypothetical protein